MDRMAGALFVAANRECRCGELFDCLTSGGSATLDRTTGRLVLVTRDLLAEMGDNPPDIWAEIVAERHRAHALHGRTSMESCDPMADRRLRVLVEEVGEVARVLNDAEHIVACAEVEARVGAGAVDLGG